MLYISDLSEIHWDKTNTSNTKVGLNVALWEKMYHIFIRILDLKIKVIFFHDHFTIILRKEGGRAFTFPTSEAEKLEINCTQHTCTTHFPTICDVTHALAISDTHTRA